MLLLRSSMCGSSQIFYAGVHALRAQSHCQAAWLGPPSDSVRPQGPAADVTGTADAPPEEDSGYSNGVTDMAPAEVSLGQMSAQLLTHVCPVPAAVAHLRIHQGQL